MEQHGWALLRTKTQRPCRGLCLVVASVLLASLLCEAALRLLFPKYRHAAEGRMQADDMRIYAPLPDYPIRRIRTGQHVLDHDGEELRLHNLWEGEADIGA